MQECYESSSFQNQRIQIIFALIRIIRSVVSMLCLIFQWFECTSVHFIPVRIESQRVQRPPVRAGVALCCSPEIHTSVRLFWCSEDLFRSSFLFSFIQHNLHRTASLCERSAFGSACGLRIEWRKKKKKKQKRRRGREESNGCRKKEK